LAGDAGAAEDAEFLFRSIRHRLRDRDAIRREIIAKSRGPRWILESAIACGQAARD